jgi:hypothetical protein
MALFGKKGAQDAPDPTKVRMSDPEIVRRKGVLARGRVLEIESRPTFGGTEDPASMCVLHLEVTMRPSRYNPTKDLSEAPCNRDRAALDCLRRRFTGVWTESGRKRRRVGVPSRPGSRSSSGPSVALILRRGAERNVSTDWLAGQCRCDHA